MNRPTILFCLLFIQLALPLAAVEVGDIYASRLTEKEVVETSEVKAKVAAFKQMLVRVSGNQDVLQDEIIQQQYPRLNNYIAQFGFVEAEGERYYEVSFNPTAVNRLLRQASRPIWESRRPFTLIWLTGEVAGERELLNEQSALLAGVDYLHVANRRGFPVSFPVLDLDDLMQVSASDVWGNFAQPLLNASQRYAADQFVLAKLYQNDNNQYQLSWHTYSGDSNQPLLTPWQSGTLTGELPQLVDSWMEALADQFGERFAVQTLLSESDSLRLELHNLASFEQLLQAERLVRDLVMVSSIQLNEFDKDRCVFTINILGSQQDLIEAMALDPHFKKIELSGSLIYPVLSYMWQI